MNQLLAPVRIGRLVAPNRLVMAPMTRSRADNAKGYIDCPALEPAEVA